MIRVAIAGLGRIGATYATVGDVPRNHLTAALATPGLAVATLVDPDPARREAAGRIAPGAALLASSEEIAEGSIDILVDARPPGDRAGLIRTAAAKGARVIVIEKPLASNIEEAIAAVAAVRKTGLAARVNFHRRFDAGHRALREAMGERPVAVSAHYAKGLANYGSHLIDLLLDWMGPIGSVRAVEPIPEGEDDPSIGFDIRFADGRTGTVRTLLGVGFDVFEVTFFGPTTRADLGNGGAHRTLARAADDLHYRGYTHLAPVPLAMADGPVGGLAELYSALKDHLDQGAPLPGARVEDALAGMAVIDAVRRSSAGRCVWRSATPSPSLELTEGNDGR